MDYLEYVYLTKEELFRQIIIDLINIAESKNNTLSKTNQIRGLIHKYRRIKEELEK